VKKAVNDVLNGDSKKDDNKALKEAAVAVPVVALVIAGEAWHRGVCICSNGCRVSGCCQRERCRLLRIVWWCWWVGEGVPGGGG